MKIKPQHLEYMRAAIEPKMREYPRHAYRQLSDERYRWDLFYVAGLAAYACSTLYSYLNDAHIDTALRHIMGMTS